jgi:broad specificity phosphatase PhoE
MANLILARHGQSLWNAENKFTGWVDVPFLQEAQRSMCDRNHPKPFKANRKAAWIAGWAKMPFLMSILQNDG